VKGSNIVDNKEFTNFIKEIKEDKYIFWKYNGYSEEILFRHEHDNCKHHEFYITPELFVDGYRCPICYANEFMYKRRTVYEKLPKKIKKINLVKHEKFLKKLNEKFGDVYNVLECFTNTDEKILIEHKCPDGDYYQWKVSPSHIFKSKGTCPKCEGKARGEDEFKRKLKKAVGDEYILISEYIMCNIPVILEHNVEDCHCQFPMKASNFLNSGSRCPSCTPASRGESKIEEILINNDISHTRQYMFSDCRNIYPLRFDFAIFEDKEKTKLKYLIEYQGEQHYKPRTFRGVSEEEAIKAFEGTKMRDEIKYNYCKTNNIKLLEIPYWDSDKIEEIIKRVS
jgi:hypothetical protein